MIKSGHAGFQTDSLSEVGHAAGALQLTTKHDGIEATSGIAFHCKLLKDDLLL